MNKISKKIVALATMAAFVLTLVPAAAFAATEEVDPRYSSVQTAEKNVKVEVNDYVNYGLTLKDDDEAALSGHDNNVYVWVEKVNEDGTTTVARNVTYYANDNMANEVKDEVGGYIEYLDGGRVLRADNSWDGHNMSLVINEAGTYILKAGVLKSGVDAADEIKDLAEFDDVDNYSTIEVSVPEVANLTFTCADANSITVSDADDTVYTMDLIGDDFIANTSDTCEVVGTIVDEDGDPIANKEVKLSSADKALWFTGDAADGVVTTNKDGEFTFTFKMNDNRNVPITITIDDKTYTLRVIKEQTRAYDIDTVEDGGYVLAGDSEKWSQWSAVDFGTKTVELDDAMTFSVADIKGDAVGIEDMSGEPATDLNATSPAHAQYIDILEKPDDSDLDAGDLYLDEVSDGVYSLVYTYAGTDPAAKRVADLTPGKYQVSVSLLSGDSAVATFYVADYGTTQSLELNMTATDQHATNRTVDITDEVTLGQTVTINPVYVDENGIKLTANDVDFGGNGKAVVDERITNNTFATKADVEANASLIGSTIEVVATSQAVHQTVWAELTVVDSYNALGLEFDPVEGPVNEDNEVTVEVVKEDGTRAQVTGEIVSAYVADQSNKDAKVYVEGVNNDVRNGRGTITVYASDDTTADIVVAVKDSSNSGLYAATLEYNFGDVDITAHHEVTMTIGSSQYVVDKQLFEMDAAPYVDSAWRTMIPIRALAEAFDATVTYDNDDRTVTIEYENEVIVMTIGEDTYTVNDEEMTMDTEPVIQGDRTYVPIRFVAEAMGFTVTPLYNANSSTASVVFQS